MSPALTLIALMVPAFSKLTSMVNDSSVLPVLFTFSVTVPRLTRAVRAVSVGVSGLPACNAVTTSSATSRAASPMFSQRRRGGIARNRATGRLHQGPGRSDRHRTDPHRPKATPSTGPRSIPSSWG